MRILALQLKRIGDLILTTPALSALRTALPGAHLTLAVVEGSAGLLPAIQSVDRTAVFGRGVADVARCGQILAAGFDACLDFTGNDRSAFLTTLSRARIRVAFEDVHPHRVRAFAYHRFVASPVRERHTTDHYLDLLRGVDLETGVASITLRVPEEARSKAANLVGSGAPYAVIHPGTARAEKYWESERWAAVITHLRERHGIECVITGGADAVELRHIQDIKRALPQRCRNLAGKLDLLAFAAVIEQSRICISCDTAAVHFGAAFETPQIALYGPTNPFHWRPRHSRAVVISAAHPTEPLRAFDPRMKGAPMAGISTDVVLRATDALLSR